MNRMTAALAVLTLAVTASSTALSAQGFLADRHQAVGATCESCHGKAAPTSDVAIETCLKCHEGSYGKLSEKVDTGDIAFHASHVGEAKCTECHQGHKAPILLCNQCHEFDVKVP